MQLREQQRVRWQKLDFVGRVYSNKLREGCPGEKSRKLRSQDDKVVPAFGQDMRYTARVHVLSNNCSRHSSEVFVPRHTEFGRSSGNVKVCRREGERLLRYLFEMWSK